MLFLKKKKNINGTTTLSELTDTTMGSIPPRGEGALNDFVEKQYCDAYGAWCDRWSHKWWVPQYPHYFFQTYYKVLLSSSKF